MSLPYPNSADVKVFANEYVNINTLNRALLRLFYNDSYLAGLSSLDPVAAPTVANMLLVATGPGTYTWKTDTQVKTLLNITDSIFGLSDVDENDANMLDGYGLFWDATKDAFVGKKGATELNDLDDVIINTPSDLHSIFYSAEYGAFINGFPDDFTIGYVQHVTLEEDGKVILPEVETVGRQIVVTKLGTSTSVYIVPNSANKINGQSSMALKSSNSDELVATIHIRSIQKEDESIEWVAIGGDGTFEFISSGLVPGSSIQIRTLTDDDLMLAPYDITVSGVPDATELVKGIVRLATEAEAQTGTATDIAVTPWGVKYWFDNFAIPFATDPQFQAGTSTDTVVTPAQIHAFDTEYVALTGGTTGLNQTATGTYVYNIADFTGTGLDTDEIRMIYISTQAVETATEGWITATMPDGTAVYINRIAAYGGGDYVKTAPLASIPINKGQTDITLTIQKGANNMEFTIVGVSQRVFDN